MTNVISIYELLIGIVAAILMGYGLSDMLSKKRAKRRHILTLKELKKAGGISGKPDMVRISELNRTGRRIATKATRKEPKSTTMRKEREARERSREFLSKEEFNKKFFDGK